MNTITGFKSIVTVSMLVAKGYDLQTAIVYATRLEGMMTDEMVAALTMVGMAKDAALTLVSDIMDTQSGIVLHNHSLAKPKKVRKAKGIVFNLEGVDFGIEDKSV